MPDSIRGASPILLLEWWKPVVGFEGIYDISNIGNVRSSKTNQLKKKSLRGGYPAVATRKENRFSNKFVHVLVAEAFVGHRPTNYVVNHIDGNKWNSHRSNLEYVTVARNNQHATMLGLNPMKLTPECVKEILGLIGNVPTSDIAHKFGVHKATVISIGLGKTWKEVYDVHPPRNVQRTRAGRKLRGSSNYAGVSFDKANNKWHAYILPNGRAGKRVHLGFFEDEIEAAKAYNVAALKYFGDQASLNKIIIK